MPTRSTRGEVQPDNRQQPVVRLENKLTPPKRTSRGTPNQGKR